MFTEFSEDLKPAPGPLDFSRDVLCIVLYLPTYSHVLCTLVLCCILQCSVMPTVQCTLLYPALHINDLCPLYCVEHSSDLCPLYCSVVHSNDP